MGMMRMPFSEDNLTKDEKTKREVEGKWLISEGGSLESEQG